MEKTIKSCLIEHSQLHEAALQFGPTVITNCTLGSVGHQRWYGEGDSPSVGKADIWCEERGGMRLIEGLLRKLLAQTLTALSLPL